MRAHLRKILLTNALLLACPPWASGQSILVQVTEMETGLGLPGAFVSLLDGGGRVVRSALGDSMGRLLFSIPAPGAYRVRAEMIGRQTQVSPLLACEGGESHAITLPLSLRAIPLTGIRVEADMQCRVRPQDAPHLARVWEEARTALTVQAWSEREGLYRLRVSTYERDLDSEGRRVEREERKTRTGLTRSPFVSLPTQELLEGGFVRPVEEGGHQYFAPDASVLLSERFLDNHCFRLMRSAELPGSIGLGFEPLRGTGIPDIQGTLWLDEETAHLRSLEFRYTRLPFPEAKGVAGGRLEFRALPNGAWVVDRWWIRAPLMGRRTDLVRRYESGIRVTGIRETGGEVLEVTTLAHETVSEAERATITGLVWDSTRAEPMGGATVHLSGTQFATVSDSAGRFEFGDLPGGVYMASFTHPRLDSLGILPSGVEVEALPGVTSELRLSTPSESSILLGACRVADREEGPAVLTGTVRDGTSGRLLPGAAVRVQWQKVVSLEPRVRATDRWFEAITDGEGRYIACGIPLDEVVQVQASFLDWRSPVAELALPVVERRILDLAIALPPGLLSDGLRMEGRVADEGGQGVQGVLLEPSTRAPVVGAEITVEDASGAIVVGTVTDRRGFFRLQTPAPGRYLIAAQALGYAGVENQEVVVAVGRLAVLEIQIAPDALELDPLVVTAETRHFRLEMEGFYEREARGLHHGIFLSPEVLEGKRPRKVSDVLIGLPGVRVGEPVHGSGPRAVWFRVAEGSNVCWPMVFVDRHLVSTGGLRGAGAEPAAVDELVPGPDVGAIEVYPGASEVPPEFNGPNAGCGVIVIWTRRGRADF